MTKLIISLSIFMLFGKALAGECPPGKYFVSTYKRNAYYRTDGTLVKEATVSAHCRTNHFFGHLKLVFKDKMPEGWPYQLDTFKAPTNKEKTEIEKAIRSLPNSLKSLGEIKIYRSIKSLFPLNHSTSGPDDNIIVLYDSVFNFGLKRALSHEMAHILYSHLDKNEKEEYQSISKWNEIAKDIFTTSITKFSESDGTIGPEEDFSNNIEHIINNKNYSKVIDKEITDYLNSILGITK